MTRTCWTGLLVGLVVGVVVFSAVSGLSAQERGRASAGDVVCLDPVKVFAEYQRQKDLTEEMHTVEDQTQGEVNRRKDEIDKLQATIDAMSQDDPTLVKRMRELFQLQLDAKNWLDLRQAEMAREVGLWSRRIYGELVAAAEEIAQREGYDVVLYMSPPEIVGFDPDTVKEQIRGRKVIYSSPNVDITQAVLDKLNETYRAQPKAPMLQIGQ